MTLPALRAQNEIDAIPQIAPAPAARPLRIAVPKKGRLCAAFEAAMDAEGLRVEKSNPRLDFGMLRDAQDSLRGVEALQMRSNDALRAVAAGAADMAVVGLDMLREFNAHNPALDGAIVQPLGLTPCGLYIAAPAGMDVADADALRGMRIATSFPGVLSTWLAAQGVYDAAIIECEGGVEDMVRLGLADVVCDLVETGSSLAANNLEKKMKVLDSQAVLVIAAPARDNAACAVVAERISRAAARVAPVYA